jgi:hypothetical protein
LTASDVDSWLLPSANGAVPDAHEWPAYTSNTRCSGSWGLGLAAAISCASRFMTGASSAASAVSSAARRPAVAKK